MDQNYDQKVSIEEFIKVFLEADNILTMKVENCKKIIRECNIDKNESVNKMEECKRIEILNNQGISNDSFISVNVIEFKSKKQLERLQLYVTIQLGNSKVQTNLSKLDLPFWNENFNLFIYLFY